MQVQDGAVRGHGSPVVEPSGAEGATARIRALARCGDWPAVGAAVRAQRATYLRQALTALGAAAAHSAGPVARAWPSASYRSRRP